jgi:ABC-2 type transport system ATP-binding protein
LLLGLLRADAGEIRLFDETLTAHNRQALLRRTGSLVEMPALYDHLSAYDNLRLNQRLLGCARHRIEHVLRLFALHDAQHRRVSQFSLGMKQRLGLALALLHEPKLLILDEPTNGLDPNGIREIRELLKQLPALTGATVFVSSHLLDEVEKIADHVAVMHRGQLRFQGRLAELQSQSTLEIRAFNGDIVRQTLRGENVAFDYDHDAALWRVHRMSLRDTSGRCRQTDRRRL